MNTTDIANFIRVELLKERINLNVKVLEQCDNIGCEYHTLNDFMNRTSRHTYSKHEPFIYKVINYLISKNIIVLCPQQKKTSSNG